ncbi:MAG: class I SAM-dependent methyltransferase [Thermomicrobiaceae bacterium]
MLCSSTFSGRAFVCRPCADRYREGPVPEDVLRTFYREVDVEYPEWANTYGNYNPPRALVSYLDQLDRSLDILEVGSGGGYLLEDLWNRGFHNLTGSDITVTSMAEMNRRAIDVTVVGADAEALPFREGSFDVVISSDVIEHLPVVTSHLLDVRRVLRPGGRYLLKTPNRRPAELYYRLRGLYDYHIWHPSMSSPAEIVRLMRRFGFDVDFLPVDGLTAAQLRKIPGGVLRSVAGRLPIGRLPVSLHPHLELVATRNK